MRKWLVGLMFGVILSTSVFAQPNMQGLSDAQRAEVEAQIANMKKQNAEGNSSMPQQFKEWVDVGTAVGKGLVSLAHEVGVEANHLAGTPVGKVAIGILIWKVMGQDIIDFAVGTMMFVVGVPLWVYFYRRMCLIQRRTTKPTERKTWYGRVVMETTTEYMREGDCDTTRFMMMFVLILLVGVSVAIAV